MKKKKSEWLLESSFLLMTQVSLLIIASVSFARIKEFILPAYFAIAGLLVGLAALFLLPKKEILYFFENNKKPLFKYILSYYSIIGFGISLPLWIAVLPYYFHITSLLYYFLGLMIPAIFFKSYLLKEKKYWREFVLLILFSVLSLSFFYRNLIVPIGVLFTFIYYFFRLPEINQNLLFLFLTYNKKTRILSRKFKNVLYNKELILVFRNPIYLGVALLGTFSLSVGAIFLGNEGLIIIESATILMTILLNDALTLNSIGLEKEQLDWLIKEKVPITKIYQQKNRFYSIVGIFIPLVFYTLGTFYFSYFSILNWLSILGFCTVHYSFIFLIALNHSLVVPTFYKVSTKYIYMEVILSILLWLLFLYLQHTVFYYLILTILIVKNYKKIKRFEV
ncbi:hypothetical protein [Enterococcus sp. DIV1420a]|uniref:hypothetical protein n=1 Tax=Enterococcus sp. DIV1420a TaxID=2774672 RepID=UPI003F6843EF